jgi:hypothetical protein
MYKIRNLLLCPFIQSPVPSSVLGPNIPLRKIIENNSKRNFGIFIFYYNLIELNLRKPLLVLLCQLA